MTEFYPGSTTPIRVPTGDSDVHSPLVGGKEYKTASGGTNLLFTIGELAQNLNRSSATVRRWEHLGFIPPATFIKPGKGRNPHGRRRLYSEAQVRGLLRIAEEEGILENPKAVIAGTKFVTKSFALFKELSAK